MKTLNEIEFHEKKVDKEDNESASKFYESEILCRPRNFLIQIVTGKALSQKRAVHMVKERCCYCYYYITIQTERKHCYRLWRIFILSMSR